MSISRNRNHPNPRSANAGHPEQAGLALKNAELMEALHEAELKLAIQTSASRILGVALACDPEDPERDEA